MLFIELGFENKRSFSDLRRSSVYRKEWYGFITLQYRHQDTVCCRH